MYPTTISGSEGSEKCYMYQERVCLVVAAWLSLRTNFCHLSRKTTLAFTFLWQDKQQTNFVNSQLSGYEVTLGCRSSLHYSLQTTVVWLRVLPDWKLTLRLQKQSTNSVRLVFSWLLLKNATLRRSVSPSWTQWCNKHCQVVGYILSLFLQKSLILLRC